MCNTVNDTNAGNSTSRADEWQHRRRCVCAVQWRVGANAPSRMDVRQEKSRLNTVPALLSATCWSTSLIPCTALAIWLVPLSPRFMLATRNPNPTAVPFSAIHPNSRRSSGMGMRIGRPVWWKAQAHWLTDTQVPDLSSNRRWFANMTCSRARTLSKHAWVRQGGTRWSSACSKGPPTTTQAHVPRHLSPCRCVEAANTQTVACSAHTEGRETMSRRPCRTSRRGTTSGTPAAASTHRRST